MQETPFFLVIAKLAIGDIRRHLEVIRLIRRQLGVIR